MVSTSCGVKPGISFDEREVPDAGAAAIEHADAEDLGAVGRARGAKVIPFGNGVAGHVRSVVAVVGQVVYVPVVPVRNVDAVCPAPVLLLLGRGERIENVCKVGVVYVNARVHEADGARGVGGCVLVAAAILPAGDVGAVGLGDIVGGRGEQRGAGEAPLQVGEVEGRVGLCREVCGCGGWGYRVGLRREARRRGGLAGLRLELRGLLRRLVGFGLGLGLELGLVGLGVGALGGGVLGHGPV